MARLQPKYETQFNNLLQRLGISMDAVETERSRLRNSVRWKTIQQVAMGTVYTKNPNEWLETADDIRHGFVDRLIKLQTTLMEEGLNPKLKKRLQIGIMYYQINVEIIDEAKKILRGERDPSSIARNIMMVSIVNKVGDFLNSTDNEERQLLTSQVNQLIDKLGGPIPSWGLDDDNDYHIPLAEADDDEFWENRSEWSWGDSPNAEADRREWSWGDSDSEPSPPPRPDYFRDSDSEYEYSEPRDRYHLSSPSEIMQLPQRRRRPESAFANRPPPPAEDYERNLSW